MLQVSCRSFPNLTPIYWSSFRFLNLDVQVLNFALHLELLEREFYKRGLSRYSKEDFKKAGYPAWVRGRFEQIYEHEKTHVQFLESALTAAGADYVKPCEYNLCVYFFLLVFWLLMAFYF